MKFRGNLGGRKNGVGYGVGDGTGSEYSEGSRNDAAAYPRDLNSAEFVPSY